jgi:hypothetical protein
VSRDPAPAWYDAGAEHLLIAFLEVAGHVAATRGSDDRTPLLAFAGYELTRAEPSPRWPAPARLVARLERGIFFCGSRRHYAADEELTAYLAELDEPAARALLSGVPGQKNPLLAARGVGRLVRGWNRLQLDREDAGLADLDGGLADLEGAGIENEATLWTWAVVHARRGKSADAARALEKLSRSPHLEPEARTEVQASAAALRSSGKLPGVLGEGRAVLLVARALVARAGGMEQLVAAVAGPARAHRVVAPLQALLALEERVARASDPGALAGKAGALGSGLLDRVKGAVGGGEPQPAAK